MIAALLEEHGPPPANQNVYAKNIKFGRTWVRWTLDKAVVCGESTHPWYHSVQSIRGGRLDGYTRSTTVGA